MIRRFKYEGWRCLAPVLAAMVGERMAVEGPPAGLLIAVPLHERRRRSRGYNQSELLAEELRRRFALAGQPGWLVRSRDTAPQVGLDRPRRLANMAGAFDWRGPPLAGRSVVLVDDVATTCATLEACAAALRGAGSGQVEGFTVARVSV